jgi:hypothetical protein
MILHPLNHRESVALVSPLVLFWFISQGMFGVVFCYPKSSPYLLYISKFRE